MATSDRRWDIDARGHGIADGRWIEPAVRRFLDALAEPGWVAEEPDVHLLPHLVRACDVADSPWRLRGAALRDDGVYVVDLAWGAESEQGLGLRRLRAEALALLGAVVECALFVRELKTDAAIEFRAATGVLDGDSPFKGHGHLLLLRVGGPVVERLLREREASASLGVTGSGS